MTFAAGLWLRNLTLVAGLWLRNVRPGPPRKARPFLDSASMGRVFFAFFASLTRPLDLRVGWSGSVSAEIFEGCVSDVTPPQRDRSMPEPKRKHAARYTADAMEPRYD